MQTVAVVDLTFWPNRLEVAWINSLRESQSDGIWLWLAMHNPYDWWPKKEEAKHFRPAHSQRCKSPKLGEYKI